MTVIGHKEGPQWNGEVETFATFKEKLQDHLVELKIADAIPKLNRMNWPAPTGKFKETKRQKSRATAGVILSKAVSKATRVAIITRFNKNTKGKRISDAPDPILLWQAFEEFSQGEIKSITGDRFHKKVESWRWPIGGDYTTQVTAALTQLTSFFEQATQMANAEYPLTQSMCCSRFSRTDAETTLPLR